MSGLRFDSEQDYQRFLDSYQHRKGGAKEPQAAILAPQSGAKAEDKAVVLLRAIVEAKLPGTWYREFTFHESRGFRLDLADAERRLGCEIDGEVHRIKGKFARDMDKHNLLILAGWRWVRCTPAQVDSGEALALLRALIQEVV